MWFPIFYDCIIVVVVIGRYVDAVNNDATERTFKVVVATGDDSCSSSCSRSSSAVVQYTVIVAT